MDQHSFSVLRPYAEAIVWSQPHLSDECLGEWLDACFDAAPAEGEPLTYTDRIIAADKALEQCEDCPDQRHLLRRTGRTIIKAAAVRHQTDCHLAARRQALLAHAA